MLDNAINASQINNALRDSGVAFDCEAAGRINSFLEILVQFNQHTNLVSKHDIEHNLGSHVADSLSLVPVIDRHANRDGRLIDIGTGGGFPAMILLVVLPDLKSTMIDSVGKKCRFLEEAVDSLSLGERAQVINGRAEEQAHNPDLRGRYQIATARAVGSMAVICELAVPFLAVGGVFLMQKTKRQLEDEMKEASGLLARLGGEIEAVVTPVSSPKEDGRIIAVVRKTAETPSKYPRPWAKIKR